VLFIKLPIDRSMRQTIKLNPNYTNNTNTHFTTYQTIEYAASDNWDSNP